MTVPDNDDERRYLPERYFGPAVPEVRVPVPLRASLDRLLGAVEGDGGWIELRIETRDRDLDLREFAAYLALTDRVYGRLTHGNLRRYARSPEKHLKLAEVRQGSLLLVFKQAVETVLSPSGLILTGLVLKFLPDIIRAPAAAFRDYEEGRLQRSQRKQLSARVAADDQLSALSSREANQIAAVLSKVYELEEFRSASAKSFAIRSVTQISIIRTKK